MGRRAQCIDFVIAGAQRSGTTALLDFLAGSADVCVSAPKEIHYYDLHYHDRSLEWYLSHFTEAGKAKGEATPYYMAHPHALRRLHDDFPDTKIIFLLRDPVRRAQSHYWHEVRLGFENLPMNEAFGQEESRTGDERRRMESCDSYESLACNHFSYLYRGRYDLHLQRALETFSADQVLILKSEHLFSNAPGVIEELLDFLGVTSPATGVIGGNAKQMYPPMSAEMENDLRRYFDPTIERLNTMVKKDLRWW